MRMFIVVLFPAPVLSQQAHDVAFGNDDVQIFVDEFLPVVMGEIPTFDDRTFCVHI